MKYSHNKKTRQYTIRDVPQSLDEVLRDKAKSARKSLNQVVLEALRCGAGLSESKVLHTDLDDIIGSWVEDKKVSKALADQKRIDLESWK